LTAPEEPTVALRRLVNGPGFTMVPGAVDPLSARLTGGGYSRAQGFPDLGLLTMTEITQWVARVVGTVSIPVIADGDTGYGNAVNVVRTVREFERAGAAGLHIEDQIAPKRCGHYDGKEVISPAEMVGKIKAAVDSRRDHQFVIIARTDARAVHGLDEAIERVHAYMEAGADVGFIEAPQSRRELEVIPQRVAGPLLVNIFEGGKTPSVDAHELETMGYRLGIYPSQTHRAAIRAAQDVLVELRERGTTEGVSDQMVSFAERERIVGTDRWHALELRYLGDPASAPTSSSVPDGPGGVSQALPLPSSGGQPR
jgi:2-methylisocitrate lyase-like PEP mutase family enzyme